MIEVSGRIYPVEVRYRPLRRRRDAAASEADDEEDARGSDRRRRRGPVARGAGRHPRVPARRARDPRDRRPAARERSRAVRMRRQVEILPLFARLSVAEQQRVFGAERGRRIVLATNVAETSLTVPGIRYVIDAGLARVKRYTLRNKTTLLQIEKISQAAAQQRAGRCGRVAERHLRAAVRRGRLREAAAPTPSPRSCAARSPR